MRLTLALVFFANIIFAQSDMVIALDSLDDKILVKQQYYNEREQRIKALSLLISSVRSDETTFDLYKTIFKEYLPYNSDSALYYSGKCLELANLKLDYKAKVDAKLLKSKSLILLGFYGEAKEILNSIKTKSLSKSQLSHYYVNQVELNRFKSIYLSGSTFLLDFNELRASYQDSLLNILDKSSPKYKVSLADRKRDVEDYISMRDIMIESLNSLKVEDREYGYTAYTLAEAYGLLGQEDLKVKYLAQSAMSDIVGGVRENSAIRELALLLLKRNDISRSNKYIRIAFEDAVYSNARLRAYEVSQILPLIDLAYDNLREKMSSNKTLFGIVISLLALFFFFILVYILKQKRKLELANSNNRLVNKQLFDLNMVLEETNKRVSSDNITLESLNNVKQEYIAHYIKLSSSYIEKIDVYRKMLYKKASNDKKETLLKLLRSNDFVNEELKSFYKDFDRTFLDLYPNFVRDMNTLLKEDERIVLKADELMNVELRIYALIRLGISESAQIAKILRYSVTTIYNYRTKMRNSSKYSKSIFKEKVAIIGTL
ncbi:MAG: hypothetical protein KAH10_04580 [Flavobacteriales bacterium]|nr:hypothetical protein [Flavobacteriales bacterium]